MAEENLEKRITLRLLKGNETALVVDNVEQSIRENDYLASSYERAEKIAREYIKRSQKVIEKVQKKEDNSETIEEALYCAPQNIIAFTGSRGTGKTSTMLSFAKYLKNTKIDGVQFVILDPIDPTMLENDQNILMVILSRLMVKAEKTWNQCSGRFSEKEQEKNRILKKIKDCLDGTNAVKTGKADSVKTLDSLQRFSDSAALKKNIYELVDAVSSFCLPDGGYNANFRLVLQIDDTDCQMEKAYEVMEDIRRYLTIPNMMILMATNIDQLRQLFVQHYLDAFKTNLDHNILDEDDIKVVADKALIKLISPSHKINIPVADDVFVNKKDILDLIYIDESNNEELLDKGLSVQSKVLRYIYKKTRLVFVAHSKYINDIVPNTLRELAYFLNVLSSLEDVPEIPDSAFNNQNTLKKYINTQLSVLDKNLDRFEEYFLGEWIYSNLPNDMAKEIREIAKQADTERMEYALNTVVERYEWKGDFIERKSSGDESVPEWISSDLFLDYYLKKASGKVKLTSGDNIFGDIYHYRQQEDFYYVFAIKTLLAIKNMRYICTEKQKCNNLKELFCNYNNHDKLILPECFWLAKGSDDIEILTGSAEMKIRMLRIAKVFSKYLRTAGLPNKSNKLKYKLQELALMLSVNGDVQEILTKECVKSDKEAGKEAADNVIIKNFLNRLSGVNNEMLSDFITDDVEKEVIG